jgi:hypothetical protein
MVNSLDLFDDFLHAGVEQFDSNFMNKLTERFVAGKVEANNFRYIGFYFKQNRNGITIDQNEYLNELETGLISTNRASQKLDSLNQKEQTSLRQLVSRLNWAVQGSRPDMAFEMISLSTKLKNGTVDDLLQARKVIRSLKQTEAIVHFPQLSQNMEWRIVLFTDASHANICQGTGSVGAHVAFLVDKSGACCPIDWQANKIKRVVRSTLAAETLSVQEGHDSAYYPGYCTPYRSLRRQQKCCRSLVLHKDGG